MTELHRPPQGKYKCTAETRSLLLHAGTELLLAAKNKPLTSRLVAERAKVSHALIAYHFGSFSSLMEAVFEQCLHNLRLDLMPVLSQFSLELQTSPGTRHGAALKKCVKDVLRVLQGDDSIALLRAVNSQNGYGVKNIYPRFTAEVLSPMFHCFLDATVHIRGIAPETVEAAVLAQSMLALCMSFFRGAPLVQQHMGWESLGVEEKECIEEHIADAVLRVVTVH